MASVLKNLGDEDLQELRHKLRRDCEGDLEIARWAEKKIGTIGPTDSAKIMAIHRYRKGREFAAWLKRWENQDAEFRRQIELQKQRFEFLGELVKGSPERGLYAASNHLKARLLTIAAELSDEDLREGKVGWIKGLLQEIRDAEKMERDHAGEKAVEVARDEKLSPAERERRVKEIFGIAK